MKSIKSLSLLLFLLLFTSLAHAQQMRTVTQVIYGDTLLLDGGETVKMIGVEAPKVVQKFNKDGTPKKPDSLILSFQNRAIEFTKGVIGNRQVWLEYDDSVKKNDQGQTVAYVYFRVGAGSSLGGGGENVLVTPGDYMINRLVLEYGFAHEGSKFNYKYRSDFSLLANQAAFQKKGLWQSNF